MNEIQQIVPAAAGWRIIEARLGFTGNLDSTAADVIFERAIACFALVAGDDEEEPSVLPVAATDWPSYLNVCEEEPGYIDMLGPNEFVGAEHISEARTMIAAFRESDER